MAIRIYMNAWDHYRELWCFVFYAYLFLFQLGLLVFAVILTTVLVFACSMRVSHSAFFQINPPAAAVLFGIADSWASPHPNTTLLGTPVSSHVSPA
jgi:hypothetical protein